MIRSKTQDASGLYCLILNTAGLQTQVGLCLDDQLVAIKEAEISNDHTRDIISYTDAVLKSAHIDLHQLDTIAVVVGPGSYTGIRIGIATAQGLALPGKIKLLPLSLLEALAWQNKPSAPALLVSVLPSRNELIYYQIFNQDFVPLSSPAMTTSDRLIECVAPYQAQYPNHSLIILEDNQKVNLATLGQLAYYNRQQGGAELMPLYINQPNYRKVI